MTRTSKTMAMLAVAVVALVGCGGDDGADGTAEDSQTEGSGDGGAEAATIPADQAEVSSEEVCSAIPADELPFADTGALELTPEDVSASPGNGLCSVDNANGYQTVAITYDATGTVGGYDATDVTVAGRPGSTEVQEDMGCFLKFERAPGMMTVEVYTDGDISETCATAQEIAEVIAPHFPTAG